MKSPLRSVTVATGAAIGVHALAVMSDPSGSVGGAVTYLLQVALGMALSHGTDVNRPEIDLAQIVNAATTVGLFVGNYLGRRRATGPLR